MPEMSKVCLERACFGVGVAVSIEESLLLQISRSAASRAWAKAGVAIGVALARDPDNGRLRELAGLLQHASQSYPASRQKLESAFHLVPLRPSAWCALADCYLHAGVMQDAREIFAYVALHAGSSNEILRYCASRLDALGEAARALEAARRLVDRQNENAHAVYEFGYYLARSGASAPLVISVMKQAISLAPEKAIYRLGLAKVLAELGDPGAALTWVQELSASQLDQITCQCCLQRLASLYDTAGDRVRAHACRVRLQGLPANAEPAATFDSFVLVNEYLAEANVTFRFEIAPVSLS